MTEKTANTDKTGGKAVRAIPFAAALLLAPLVPGLPAFALVWIANATNDLYLGPLMLAVFPAAAMIVGAPTYLVFGGPALWNAMRKGYSTIGAAFLANIISLPFVGIYAALTSNEIVAALAMFAFFGSIFAPLWGAIFGILYRHFSGEHINV